MFWDFDVLTPWRPTPARWTLDLTDVHVWRIPLDLPEAQVRVLRAALAPDELARAARFRFAADARRSIVTRGALRWILAELTSTRPGDIAFDYDPRGKPRLAADRMMDTDLTFNVSHAGELALIAVTRGSAIGVDVERLREIDQVDDLVRQNFTARERAEHDRQPTNQRQTSFFKAWTRKEAVLKAMGVGLSRDPATVGIWGDPNGLLHVELGDPAEAAQWSVVSLDPGEGYVGALALRARGRTVYCLDWSIDRLDRSAADAQQMGRQPVTERGEP